MSKNKSSLVDSALDFFSGFYKSDIAANCNIMFDDAYVDNKVLNIKMLLPNLTAENLIELKNKIKSQYAIYQPDGIMILDDYEHQENWYEELDLEQEFFWDRYKRQLQNKLSPKVIDKLENDTLKNLISYLGNPEAAESFSRKGLVIGDVQSGKTSNYIGLICKAADAGYKVIFLLTGTIESLRRQTQIRVEEGFIGYDTANAKEVGVGRGKTVPFSFTCRKKDFNKGAENNTALLIEEKSDRPYIFIIKKNVSVLNNIYKAIKNNLKRDDKKIKFPMLMIDDECDNASINTNKKENDPTKTNENIRKIIALFEKSNYIGFTATPYANVFIDPNTNDDMLKNDLFPRDFIYALFPPSNYHGAKRMFVDNGENSDKYMLEIIDKNNEVAEELLNTFPLNHKKEWHGNQLHTSVYEAVDRFLLVNAIRDLKDLDKFTHRSMLINMSRFTAVQFVISDIITEYFSNTKNDIKQSYKLTKNDYLKNSSVSRLHNLFNEKYFNCGYSWEDIFETLFDSIKDIEIITVNSDKQSSKLNYDEHESGFRVIAIGGLALSRGLTLEGLMISYFYRNSATFDVLMQMGRWFGYRPGFEDLCKVYLLNTSASYYKEIILSTEQLKTDMYKMCQRKQKPTEYGIRVRNDFYNNLRITAANKMKSTKQKVVSKDFWGEMFYTPFLDYGANNEANIEETKKIVKKFAHKLDKSVARTYLRDIGKEEIVALLNNLKIDDDKNDNFDVKQLSNFIQKNEMNFDILLMSGKNNEIEFVEGINIKPATRKYELIPNSKSIMLNHYRLGGNRDTAYGLDDKIIRKINSENEGINEKNYLIKDRNPLLIIYMVKPSNDIDINDDNEDEAIERIISLKKISIEDEKLYKKYFEFEKQLSENKQPYLIGYQIGFPQSDNPSKESHVYITNINADYFKLQENYFDDGEDVE